MPHFNQAPRGWGPVAEKVLKQKEAVEVHRCYLAPKTAQYPPKYQVPKGTACEYGKFTHPKQSRPGQSSKCSILPRYPYLGSQTLPAQQEWANILECRPARQR